MRFWQQGSCLLLALVLLPLLRPALAEDSGKPFPVAKSGIVRGAGSIYYVKGEQTIPKGVKVSVQKGVKIVGRGEGARLRVEGSLVIQGGFETEIKLKDLDLVLAPAFELVRTGYCDFDKCNIITPAGKSSAGKLQVENALLTNGAKLEVRFHGGSVKLLCYTALLPTKIECVPVEGETESDAEFWASSCYQSTPTAGITGGLSVSGAAKMHVRACRIGGELASFRNCRGISFDSNLINAKRFEVISPSAAALGSLKITKCDFYGGDVVMRATKGDSKAVSNILFDRCYWNGLLDPKKILEDVVTDGEDEENNATRVRIGKIQKRPTGHAGDPKRMGGPGGGGR